ncbi:MAG: hypothetical protein ABJA81_09110, partial [Nocardioidaceae bacterium]
PGPGPRAEREVPRYVGHSVNPYRIEGQKSVAFEICDAAVSMRVGSGLTVTKPETFPHLRRTVPDRG